MKKTYVALMAGVAAGMAIAAPTAMAAVPELPPLPSLPPIPGAQPNGGECEFSEGRASASSIGGTEGYQEAISPLDELNEGNCQSFGNDQGNGAGSGKTIIFPPPGAPEQSAQ